MLCLEAVVGLQCSDQTSLLLSVSSGNGDSNRSQENAASPIAALSSRTRGCDEKDPSTSFVVPRICGDFIREEKRCGEFGILIFDIPSSLNSQTNGRSHLLSSSYQKKTSVLTSCMLDDKESLGKYVPPHM